MKSHFNKLDLKLLFSILLFVFSLSSLFQPVEGNHINSDKFYLAIADLAKLSGQKYMLSIENDSFDIFYGMSAIDGTNTSGSISSISVLDKNNSLLIHLDDVLQTEVLWIRFPDRLLSAENDEFVLFVDGEKKGYELSSHGDETRLSFIIPNGTKEVELAGSNVIPEFPAVLLTGSIIFSMMIILTRYYLK